MFFFQFAAVCFIDDLTTVNKYSLLDVLRITELNDKIKDLKNIQKPRLGFVYRSATLFTAGILMLEVRVRVVGFSEPSYYYLTIIQNRLWIRSFYETSTTIFVLNIWL